MQLTTPQRLVLQHMAGLGRDPNTGRERGVDIREISESYRQRVIDLAMMEPPLVDILGNILFLTTEGQRESQWLK